MRSRHNSEMPSQPDAMMKALRDAGCPRSGSALNVSKAEFIRTVRVCRHIRARYTNFDLADHLGMLDELVGARR